MSAASRFGVRLLSIGGGLLLGVAAFCFLPVPRHVRGEFTLRPAREAVVRAQEPGVIERVFVVEGQRVDAGTALLTLRDERIELARGRAAAASEGADAARAAALFQGDHSGAVAYQADVAAETARARYHGARASRTEIVAPFDGVVLTPRLAEQIGLARARGDSLCEIGDPRTLHAEVLLDEDLLGILETGSPVELRTRAGRRVPGEIVRVALEPSGGEVRRVYRVLVAVDNAEGKLRPGMTGAARFRAGTLPLSGHVSGWLVRNLRFDFWI